MTDNNPAPQDRKTSYIAPLVIGLVIVAVFVVFLLRQPSAPPAPPTESKTTAAEQSPDAGVPAAAPSAPVTPAAPPVLTRADMLASARDAAAAFADQNRLDGASDALIGRRFSLRIPFGCGAGQNALSQAAATIDDARRSVTLTAQPGVWTTLPLFQSLGDSVESVEGFWIPRPWAATEGCALQQAYATPATPTPPTARTFGLAQLFSATDSRVTQHAERPYAYTRKIPAGGNALLDRSYRLLLEGTISGYGDGHALRCWVESTQHQPICIFAVSFDRVAFEDGTTGEALASWTD